MHIEKNVFDNFFMLLASRDKRNKDEIRSRKHLAMYYSRKELELVAKGGEVYMPKAMYSLVRSDVKIVCDWLKSLKFPDGYISNIENYVNTSESTITWLKCHDYHVLMQRVVPVALCDLIPLDL